MPTFDISYKDLCKLAGRIKKENLEENIMYAKGEIENLKSDTIKIDLKDTNRPDLWSVEGMAREIKTRKGKSLKRHKIKKGRIEVYVNSKVKKIRPYTACVVVRNVKLNDTVLSQLIQLQEKIGGTFGRNRSHISIGVYDLDKIKTPIIYTTMNPKDINFTPLGYNTKMNAQEILSKTQKGKEYSHLLSNLKEYTVFKDSKGKILSLVPIMNSNNLGNIDSKTKNVFIECSGMNKEHLNTAITVLAYSLGDRGFKIETVNMIYGSKKETVNFSDKKIEINKESVNKVSGLELTDREIKKLLINSGYKISQKKNKIIVNYPCYRQDIMHERDVIEDIIISYGYNKIIPEEAIMHVTGDLDLKEKFCDKVANICIGIGMQEVMSYTLTNKKNLFLKMNLPQEEIVEIENPSSKNYGVFRNTITPSLMDFLSKNKNVEYPQSVFEIGDVIKVDKKSPTYSKNMKKISCAIIGTNSNYEQISSALDALLCTLNTGYVLEKTNHESFIKGRVAAIKKNKKQIGVVGEIHPKVIKNWNLELPISVFELDIESLIS